MEDTLEKGQGNVEYSDCFYSKTKAVHRIIAGFIDILIIYLTDLISFIPLILILCYSNQYNSVGKLCTVAFIGIFTGIMCSLTSLLYRAFIPQHNHDQTIGMRIMKMKYLNENGDKLSRKRLYYRAISIVFLTITTVGLYYLIEVFCLSLSTNKNSIADQLSKTIIIDVINNK